MLEERQDVTETIESISDVMLMLSELEAATEQMVDVYFQNSPYRSESGDDRYRISQIRQIVGNVERQARSIRAYLGRLYSSIVIRNTNEEPGMREVDRLGFKGYVDSNGIEISIPYSWISASSAFIYTVKKFPYWNSSTSELDVWHWVMEGVLKKLEPYVPFTLPLQRADIEIVMFKPRARLGDPDHFWYRPIIDTFVQRRFILNDNAQNLHISVSYAHDPANPEVRIRLVPSSESYQNKVRDTRLKRVF